MKVVQIPNYGPVSFPDSMADDEIKTRAAALANAAIARNTYTPDYRDQGLGSLMAGGFKRAASGLGSTITDTLPALAGSALGFDDYAKEQLAEAAEKRKQSEMENPTGFKSYKDVRGLGDAAGYVAETVGEFGPDILGMLTGVGVGATVGKRVAARGVEALATKQAAETIAKRGLTGEAADAYAARLAERAVTQAGAKGSERGVLAGMYGSSVGLNAPDTFEGIYEKTGKLEPGIALAFGAAQGVLDTYLPAKILRQLSPSAKDRLAVEILNRSTIVPQSAKMAVAKALGVTTAGEGFTEGLQDVLGILAEQTAGAKGSLLDPENIDRVLNATIKGAIGGTTFGAPGAIVEGRRTAALSRDEADRRDEAAGKQTAAQTNLPADIDYNRPAYERRAGGPQADLFPRELAKAKFGMDSVAKATPDNRGASYSETLDAAKIKLNRGEELTRSEADMLNQSGDMDSVKMAKAKIAPEEDVAPTIDERQMSFFDSRDVQRPERQGALDEAFQSQQPDMLGDMVSERQAAPEETDPMGQRVADLTQELIDSGMPPKAAVMKAYQQVRAEMQDDTLASLQSEPPADPRQGALQFAQPAPEGRGFREEPFNTQLPDQLEAQINQKEAQISRDKGFRQAEQAAAAQREREVGAAENQRDLQLAEPPEPAPAPMPTVREPVQESFPGMGVRYGDKVRASQEAEATEATPPTPAAGVVTQDMMTGFGVLPNAPVRKRLAGKDLSNPNQRAQVQRELTAYSTNEAVPPESRAQVKQALQSPLFMGQSEMFGPKGGATAAATGRKEAPRAELKPVEPITPDAGEGVSVPSGPSTTEAPAGVRASGDGGVDVPASGAGSAGVRANKKLTPLTTTKFEPIELVSAPEGKPAVAPEVKPETKTPVSVLQVRQAFENAQEIGRGGNAIVYDIPGTQFVLRVPNRASPPAPSAELVPVADPFPGRNFGQPILTLGDLQVLYRQNGFPAGLALPKGLSQDEADSRYSTAIKAAAEMPQSAYDQFAADLVYLDQKGGRFDPSKSNNVLIDQKNAQFNLVDIEQDAKSKNDGGDIVITLMGNTYVWKYKGSEDLKPYWQNIYKKTISAIEKNNLKFDKDSSSVAYSRKFAGLEQLTPREMLDRAEEAQRKADAAKETEGKPEAKKPEVKTEGKPAVAPEAKKEAETVKEAAGQAAAGELGRVSTVGYAIRKADVSEADAAKVTDAKKEAKPSEETKAATTYFSKVPRTIDALLNIAFDIVHKTRRYRQAPEESKAEKNFFTGMDYKAALLAEKWVRANLDADSIKALDGMIARYQKQLASSKNELAKINAEQDYVRTYLNPDAPLELSEADSMALPLHPAIADLLSKGDVQGALRMTAAYFGGTVGRLASALVRAGISPKVVIKKNLTNESGKRVPGFYDPKTDTVYLDPETGMNTHVLLHEVGHAATAYTLANPAHPLTKQLQQLFNDVKGSLDTAYGAESLDEFAAEAFSNESFRAKLNSINPKGEKISALQRFTNSVKNFFRKLIGLEPKGIETTLDNVDQVIEAMLSPSPELRDAPILYAATINPRSPVVERWLNSAADVTAKLPLMNQERADKLHGFFTGTVAGTVKEFGLSTLPLHALVDVAKKYLPSAPKVNKLVEEKGSDEGKRNEGIEPVVNEAEKWAKEHSKHLDKFNSLIYKSTIDEVDPSDLRSTYEKAPEKKGTEAEGKLTRKEKLESWDAMQKDFEAIGAAGRQTYRRMRDTYKALFNEIRESIGARIDAAGMDKTESETVKREIYARLAERGLIAPYFPLTRNGDFWLSYTAPGRDGKPDTYVSAFETERERERFIKALEKGGATQVQKFAKLSEMNYRNTPATSFVNGVLKVMDANRVPTEAREQVLRLFLQTLPESSFAQAFQKRKGTLGFNKDAIRAFREKTNSMSRQMSNMKYAAKLTAVRGELFAEAKAAGKGEGAEDNKVHKQYFDELDQRIKFAISPTTNRATQMLSSLGFNYLLGFNVSSAVVNLTQVPLIVLPYLGGKYGFGDAQKALRDAYRLYARSGFERKVTLLPKEDGKTITAKERAMPSLDNFDFDNVKDKDIKRLQTLSEVAAQAGQLNRSMFYDVLEVDGGKSPMKVFNAASGFMFHHGERMNRQVSMIAAYNLELDRLNKKGAKLEDGSMADTLSAKDKEVYAANQSIYATEMTNGGTAAASAPRIAQGAVGKVLFMFKRYGVSMYYMMFKMTKEALQTQDPAARKQAMKQLAGVYGMAAIFSGLQGLPMFGVLAMIYNMFADEDDEDLGTVVRASTNELAYKGLLNYMTNLDIAARVGLSDLIFRDNKMSSGSASLAESVAELLGGPLYGVATRIKRGSDMIGEGNVERGIEAMVPSGLGNVMRGLRFATEGANTLRGDPIVGDIGPWNALAQVFGFASADYTKQLEINARIKGADKYVNETATKLRRQYNVALRTYDMDGMQDFREKLEKLYAKHGALGNLETSLSRSKAAFDRQTSLMYHGITISPKMRDELLGLAAELAD
jgi:hypothetical protein